MTLLLGSNPFGIQVCIHLPTLSANLFISMGNLLLLSIIVLIAHCSFYSIITQLNVSGH